MNVKYTPSTTISLYAGVPWDSSYSAIRWYESGTCYSEIQSFLRERFTSYTVVKNESTTGAIRVETPFTDLSDCNYVSFQNDIGGSSDRVIFAFITDITYINLNVTEITYSIDYIQTWMDAFEVNDCFVVREHINPDEDTPGANLLPENVELGEYVFDDVYYKNYAPAILICMAGDGNDPFSGQLIGDVFTPIEAEVYLANETQMTILTTKMNGGVFKDKADLICELCMCVADMQGSNFTPVQFMDDAAITISRPERLGNILDGYYTPRNSKLLTYPYCYILADNNNGAQQEYRYDDFQRPSQCTFTIVGIPTPKPVLILAPTRYLGTNTNGTLCGMNNLQYTLFYDNFPQCPMSNNGFQQWLSSNLIQDVIGLGTSAAMAAATGGSMLPVALSAAGNLASQLGQASVTNFTHGSMGSSNATGEFNTWNGSVGFITKQMTIRSPQAEKIDAYFGTFGYSTLTDKVPNLTGRPYFNYLQTQGACVTGKIPDIAKQTLQNAMDAGCTFWHTIDIGKHDWTDN